MRINDRLGHRRNHGLAECAIWIVAVEQGGVVRGDAGAERALRTPQRCCLIVREGEDRCELRMSAEPIAHLPAPIVPLLGGGVGKAGSTKRVGACFRLIEG